MNFKLEPDIDETASKRNLFNFANELDLNIASLTIFSFSYDSFIQISPDNNYMAFMKNNKTLEIFKKENNNWEKDSLKILSSFGEKKIKGINWSYDSNMILIYGSDNNDKNSVIKVISKKDPDWICEIIFEGNIKHSSFYPDSKSIVYIKSYINTLNIFSLLRHNNLNTKNHNTKKDKLKNEYFYLKFDDERSINYIKNNNNIFMILPCYGNRTYDISNIFEPGLPRDYIVILINKKFFKYFQPKTNNLDRIMPINNGYSFFIIAEKEFYKFPFYIYNIYGEIMFKSEFPNSKVNLVTNPSLLYNPKFETNFILVQLAKKAKLQIMECENILKLRDIYYYYDYNKLYNNSDMNKKKLIFNSNNNFHIAYGDDFIDKDNILFLEEKKCNNHENEKKVINGINSVKYGISKRKYKINKS